MPDAMTSREASEMTALADRLEALSTFMLGPINTVPGVALNAAERDLIVQALRTAARHDAGCAVKAVEWRDHRPDSLPEPAWSAQTPFSFYNIEEVSASDSPAYVARLHAHHFIADKDSLDEAKAAAQADYEKRIRSALLEQPATPGYAAGFEACREAIAKLAREHRDWARSEKRDRECDEYFIAVGHESAAQDMMNKISALPAPPAAEEVTREKIECLRKTLETHAVKLMGQRSPFWRCQYCEALGQSPLAFKHKPECLMALDDEQG